MPGHRPVLMCILFTWSDACVAHRAVLLTSCSKVIGLFFLEWLQCCCSKCPTRLSGAQLPSLYPLPHVPRIAFPPLISWIAKIMWQLCNVLILTQDFLYQTLLISASSFSFLIFRSVRAHSRRSTKYKSKYFLLKIPKCTFLGLFVFDEYCSQFQKPHVHCTYTVYASTLNISALKFRTQTHTNP